MARKKWTVASDQADDRKRGIKQGSKRDLALDKKRGVLTPAERRKVKS